ncbi:hypothetical protein [Homoserinibacter sp. YIM 151385]|uniref:hypothetical protein n=1 Tax=Homoserinibacter sp. YIM 151385 TaxID=2985506 RepID=UPI0022F0642D|nr:hypothetical protein [Homoserinibacter sp. YIM 151385]WBU37057.1 hypothetical protein OF852_08970 [Homoserinibacter sp. YIM 151385]
MTNRTQPSARRRTQTPIRRRPGVRMGRVPLARTRIGAGLAAFALVGSVAVAAPGVALPAFEEEAVIDAQSFQVSDAVASARVAPRDEVGTAPGYEALIAGGTNEDWAKLVMLYGGWPMTQSNVTVMMRWMRQENYEKNWWQRNNPLNNGFGSGGGSGLGSYDDLNIAAEMAADNLNSGRYPEIAAGFAASAPTEQIERAIWASPWASSHYQNGAHWHYHDYDVVRAPADAWP